jgi:group II intron reverse transcriptase/maturase
MRDAETVLNAIRERGRRKLPLEDLYRQLYNPDLYLRAYGRIYRNAGAMTPGVTQETADGMSLDKIQTIIEALRFERYRWKPVRRVEIPKPHQPGKYRPLGLPTWSDKLLQEVIRSLLEAYYDPQFSDHSHGFRTGCGCHTALTEIHRTWRGTTWFIEGDIKGCFDNIDQTVLLSILREQVHDNRFLRLLEGLFKAGYLKDWKYHPTLSGTPQGGICSPILANIYLDRLDRFVEETLLPDFNRGDRRKPHPEYHTLRSRANYLRRTGRAEEGRVLRKQAQSLPSVDPHDPDYRRLRFIRYADDFLLGFTGPHAEAEEIKERLRTFLRETLKLELSEEKTLITHATTEAARFLGYEIVIHQCDMKHDRLGRRQLNRNPGLRVPAAVVEKRCALYMRGEKPMHRPEMARDDDTEIIRLYQAEYRGYVEFYALAENLHWLNKLHWIMRLSLLKTLACKHKSSVRKIARKHIGTMETPYGPRKCIRVTVPREGKDPIVAYFGGIALKRRKEVKLQDQRIDRKPPRRVQLIERLLAEECEICGSTDDVEVHHIRKLADVTPKGRRTRPLWMRIMSARRRKTLVVCRRCHERIHQGLPLTLRQPK